MKAVDFWALFLVVAIVGGWVANIVKLATSNEAVGLLVLRGVGIFMWPIGAVLGYL